MKLFINDKLINLIPKEEFDVTTPYDVVINNLGDLMPETLKGKVLVQDTTFSHIDALIQLMELRKLKKLVSVTYVVDHYQEAKAFVKGQFKIVKAAGGIVRKRDRFLMIYRLGKWDLPKGKVDKNERTIEAAVREIYEECQIKTLPGDKICSTWHAYVYEGKRILKKTTWYSLECLDDSQMMPQVEEDIEDLRWMTHNEVDIALKNSYRSIEAVFDSYFEKFELQDEVKKAV
jgi:8-oxo-dGTP pyrophosphatase MutT (NUDIX family)